MSLNNNNKKCSLAGNWKFAYAEEGSINEENVVSGKEHIQWLKCEVPGNAQLDLLKLGLIEDPYFGTNCEDIRKYESYEWWYTRKFSVPAEMHGKRLELIFHGLDTYSKVWINGKFIGETDNMFIPHKFDITELINKNSDNELIVKFASPIYATRDKELSGCYSSMGTFESLWARKARHTYGWDIAPRLVTAGIWRDVELVCHEDYEIKDVFFRLSELNDKYAKLVFHIDFDLPQKAWTNLKVKLNGECGDSVFETEQLLGSFHTQMVVELDDPKLWWPYNLGNPELYAINVVLYKDNIPVHSVSDKIGIRKIDIDQDVNLDGSRNFIIKINNTPVFVKGSNSVPMDAFHSRDLERIPEFINMLKDTNCNAVRVWGGGVYEHDLFYKLCDEKGIMVFQDFMYTCAIYPQTDEFLKVAENEARIIVKQLRNHPSIIIWYGDNEIDLAYYGWYDQAQSPENNKLTRRVLKEVCHYFDGTRPYLPSSPNSPTPGLDPNNEFEGDKHFYRHGDHYKSEEYIKDRARFYSEIGHLSLDNVESIKKFIPEDRLWPIDRNHWDWDHHFGSHQVPYYHRDRLGTVFSSVKNMFGTLPDNLDDMVHSSQITQAEALKFWIERSRQRKFECSGILWWNMIDCWPGFSDAIVDYYYSKKLAYDFVMRSQSDILISLGEKEDKGNPIVLVNDTLKSIECDCTVEVFDKNGTKIYDMKLEKCAIESNGIRAIGHVAFEEIYSFDNTYSYIACMNVSIKGISVCKNHYLYYKRPIEFTTYNELFDIFHNWLMQI